MKSDASMKSADGGYAIPTRSAKRAERVRQTARTRITPPVISQRIA